MIEQINIQNFQRHKKLKIAFEPGINTIVGPSDTGKSAVIRALRWVTTNQPGGEAFVRMGAGGATVKLKIDGETIQRKRGAGGVNTYHLGDQEYKAFGRGVPEPVEALVNMPAVCWQGQHDPSFWFGATPGEVSRQLNDIVDLGVIDDTLKNVTAEFHKRRNRLQMLEEGLTEAAEEGKKYDRLDDCRAALDSLTAARARYNELDATEAVLGDRLTNAAEVKRKAKEAKAFAAAAERLAKAAEELTFYEIGIREAEKANAADAAVSKLSRLCITLGHLTGWHENARDAAAKRARLQTTAKAVKAASNAPQPPDTKKLTEAFGVYAETRQALAKISSMGAELVGVNEKCDRARAAHRLAAAELADAESDICPTCGQPFNRLQK